MDGVENGISKKGSSSRPLHRGRLPLPVHTGLANLTFLVSPVDNLVVQFWTLNRARGIP